VPTAAELQLDSRPIVANPVRELNVRCKSATTSPIPHEDVIIARAIDRWVTCFGSGH
jgi:hypothetical protein